MPSLRRATISTLLPLFVLVAACSASQGRPTPPSPDAATDASLSDAPTSDAPGSTLHIVSVSIDPASATLTSVDGARPTLALTARAVLTDGTTVTPTGVTWSRDQSDVGDVDASSGLFTATGYAGGIAVIHALVPRANGGALTATGAVTVHVSQAVAVDGTPADAATHFASTPVTDETRAANILYPLDGVVMPQNVAPAEIQWERGNAGDIFRITLAKSHATMVAYVATTSDLRNAWMVDADAWRTLATSDPDESATIEVDRYIASMSAVVSSTPVHVRFARGVVLGSVYYWDLGAGQSIRINDGTGTREHFMPNPPGTTATGTGCIGCHAISHDGRYLSAETGGFEGAVFDLTTDLTGSPAATLFPLGPSAPAWYWSSFNPDSTRIVADRGSLSLYDPLSGMSIPPIEGSLPSSNASQPVWSPDGTAIAYAANINTGHGNTNFSDADIGIVPVTGPDSFGTPFIVHEGTDLATAVPPGNSDNYPTWSPNSQWIAFAHGDGYRGDTDNDALYLISRSGGEATRLDRACGGPLTTNNYIPEFSPFDTGGYFWITFQSTRDYGNAIAGTRGTRRPQVWVAAIANEPMVGGDPSEVAYWLPGQDPTSMNIEASWAPRACRQNNDECNVSSECCSSECRDDGSGTLRCMPPPPERCHVYGETCSVDSDCCEGTNLVCQGNVCINVLL